MNHFNVYFHSKATISPRHRLLFFPYAGGTGEVYIPWFKSFPNEIECIYAQLPGRGRRFHEEAFDSLSSLIEAIISEVITLADCPISFFGHSMGALIAHELACRLNQDYQIQPEILFLSGHRAPSLPYQRQFLHQLSPEELFEYLCSMGGMENATGITLDLIQPFLHTLYKDLKLCETYVYRRREPLKSKITLFWGNQDTWIQKEKIELWQQETVNQVEYCPYDGNHFYIHQHYRSIAELIKEKIR